MVEGNSIALSMNSSFSREISRAARIDVIAAGTRLEPCRNQQIDNRAEANELHRMIRHLEAAYVLWLATETGRIFPSCICRSF